jgi:hypothetical protein
MDHDGNLFAVSDMDAREKLLIACLGVGVLEFALCTFLRVF